MEDKLALLRRMGALGCDCGGVFNSTARTIWRRRRRRRRRGEGNGECSV